MDTLPSRAENMVVDVAGCIDQDIACIKCGYNLRGLDPNHICPECATPVGRSTRGDLLQFSDPDWVEKLACGMKWIFAGIVAGIVGRVALFGVGTAIGIRTAGGFRPLLSLSFILIMIPGLIVAIGLWMVTTPEPRRFFSESSTSARSLARIAAVVAFGFVPVSLLLYSFAPSHLRLINMLAAVIGIVDTVAKLTYGRQLALRIPDQKLARNSRIVMWGLTLLVSYAIITALLPAPRGATAGIGLGYFIRLASLFFSLWAIRLVYQFRKALRTSAQLSRETWSRNLS